MLHLNGFPASTCISLDDEVVHGIPSNRVISDGNLVKISLAVLVDGWHSACVRTFRMPAVSESANQIAGLAEQCFIAAIGSLAPGCSVNRVSEAIANLANEAGFGVVREYVGHGIGRNLHQEPSVPSFPSRRNESVLLRTGSCFAIEPILTAGDRHTTLDKDEWTVRTRDGSLSAEWKDTVLMTDDGPVVLTDEVNDSDNAPRFEKSTTNGEENVRKWWWPF
jgi:methionyl aminopeptidase